MPAGAPTGTITYYKNDGSNIRYDPEDTATILSPQDINWSREGYNFIEWNTSANGNGISYQPGDSQDNVALLYAIWEEKRRIITKIQLPNGQISHIGADWQDISNKPALTREQVIEIVENLYPNATSAEVEEMADDILENYNTVTEDMIEEILSRESGTPISYAPTVSPQLTGVPTAPTAAVGTNTTQIATTAFVQQAIANIGNVQGVLYGN